MVATICLPSCGPRSPAIAGTKVARLPRKYAMLHFSTPRPVLDFANAQTRSKRTCHLAMVLRNVLWPFDGLTLCPLDDLDDLRLSKGECSLGALSPLASSWLEESLKVTALLTRSPVFGRTRVAWRRLRLGGRNSAPFAGELIAAASLSFVTTFQRGKPLKFLF